MDLTYILKGVEGIKLGDRGSLGYLTKMHHLQVIDWLKRKNYWNLNELECYIAETFDVTFAAKSSYYDLFSEAGISWKKSQKTNPRKNPELVNEKKSGTTPRSVSSARERARLRRDKTVDGKSSTTDRSQGTGSFISG
jgi:putative transposase